MNERKDAGLATAEVQPGAPETGKPANEPHSTADLASTSDRADTPTNTASGPTGHADRAEEHSARLFAPDGAQELRSRWDTIQTGFIDEPRRAAEQADSLVAEVIQHLAQSFAYERSTLEQQWDRGDNTSTEDLRLALRRYRSFFDRLLSV